jgi:predicted enzyme related to lactoylglutathione lyase
MADPFDALHLPPTLSAPDPAFATRLRARVERALTLPQGVTVSDLDLTDTSDATPSDPPHHGDVAYLAVCVPDVDRAVAFYEAVLGCSYGPPLGDLGRQASGVRPRHGLRVGTVGTAVPYFVVDDVERSIAEVRGAGGRADEARTERFGHVADCTDDQGMAFALVEPLPDRVEPRVPLNGEHQGDISYLTFGVRDSSRTRAFLGEVLGWTFSGGRVDDGWEPQEVHPMTGMQGGKDHDSVAPMYRVDDVDAAVQRVRAAGGTATDAETQPYGRTSECTDDQGSFFYLGTT